MHTPQKILTITLWSAAAIGTLAVLALSKAKKPDAEPQPQSASPVVAVAAPATQPLFDLPAFKLVDQDGKEFTDQQLRGHPFVASFLFTHRAGPCPMMFAKMSAMQKSVPNPAIKLVTFTVDPERDTPEVLKAKAKEMGAEPGKWIFLTGDKDSIHTLMHDG